MKLSRRNAAATIFVGSSINSVIIAIQALVLIPLYLKHIGPYLYGAWLGSNNILVWLISLDLGLPNYLIQRIGAAHGREDEQSVGEYFFSGMLLLFLISVSVVLIGVGISSFVPGLMGTVGIDSVVLKYCFILGAIAQAINLLNNGIVALSRGIQRTLYLNIVEIVSSLIGFITALVLILTENGLWSIAIGLLVRAMVKIICNIAFSVYIFWGVKNKFLLVKRSRIKEFLTISPITTLGEISHAVRRNSDVALVAAMISPEMATILSITKKAVQIILSIVDMIPFAVYGSFANLFSSDQQERALLVNQEIHSLRLSAAVVFASAYMAINQSLVAVWLGNGQYGGAGLTILLAFQFVISGSAFLANYLYRATGKVMKGSLLLFLESTSQILLMIVFVSWLGMVGIPIPGILLGTIFGLVAHKLLLNEVKGVSSPAPSRPVSVWLAYIFLLITGAVLGAFVYQDTWIYVISAGSLMVIIGGGTLFLIDPSMGNLKEALIGLTRQLKSKF